MCGTCGCSDPMNSVTIEDAKTGERRVLREGGILKHNEHEPHHHHSDHEHSHEGDDRPHVHGPNGEIISLEAAVMSKNDAIAAKKVVRPKKKKPAVRVSPGGKGKDAPAKPIGQMGLRKIKKPTTRELQTKVLMKAKTNNMTAKNFRMKNPKDKDVQALYKANPNLKKSDAFRQEGRDYQKAFKKAKTPAQRQRVIDRQIKKDLARDARDKRKGK